MRNRLNIRRAYKTARHLLDEARLLKRKHHMGWRELVEQVHELRCEIAIERRRRARIAMVAAS